MKNGKYELIVAPENYPGLRYRGRYCYEHHYVYWKNTGHIKRIDEVIHHKNGDKRDNRFENLELKCSKQHSREHRFNRGREVVDLICPWCETGFTREKRQTHLLKCKNKKTTSCSRSCGTKFQMTKMSKQERARRMQNNVVKIRKIIGR